MRKADRNQYEDFTVVCDSHLSVSRNEMMEMERNVESVGAQLTFVSTFLTLVQNFEKSLSAQ